MMIKEAFLKVLGFIKGKAAAVATAIAGVSMMTVAKFAVAAGLTIGTALLVIKFFKEKLEMVTSKKVSKTPIEKNLDKNYSDYRKRRTLHREMDEVSNTLWNDTPRRGMGYGWMDEFEDEFEDDKKKSKNKKSSNNEYGSFVSYLTKQTKSSKKKNKKKSKNEKKRESFRRIWDCTRVRKYA